MLDMYNITSYLNNGDNMPSHIAVFKRLQHMRCNVPMPQLTEAKLKACHNFYSPAHSMHRRPCLQSEREVRPSHSGVPKREDGSHGK